MVITDVAKEVGISPNALNHRMKISNDDAFIYHKGHHNRWKSVVAYSPDGEKIVYKSVHEASQLSGVHAGNIVKVCKGERKQAGGYVFCYEDKGD